MSAAPGCPLCEGPGGTLVFQAPKFRVIRAIEAGFPAFYRVVWQEHVAEFSDLPDEDRALCMHAVVEVERAIRAQLRPDKVNIAALGNAVPHLHWHVIARFRWDTHFPGAVWATPQRAAAAAELAALEAALPELELEMVRRLRA